MGVGLHAAPVALWEGPLLLHCDEVGGVPIAEVSPEAPAPGGLSYTAWHGTLPNTEMIGVCSVPLGLAFNQELVVNVTRLEDVVLGLQVAAEGLGMELHATVVASHILLIAARFLRSVEPQPALTVTLLSQSRSNLPWDADHGLRLGRIRLKSDAVEELGQDFGGTLESDLISVLCDSIINVE